jgi:hypothetical protein
MNFNQTYFCIKFYIYIFILRWERGIDLVRTSYLVVLQSRGNLSNDLGGVTWFG